eukprot:4427-Heterococcus_DN1.PRE.5
MRICNELHVNQECRAHCSIVVAPKLAVLQYCDAAQRGRIMRYISSNFWHGTVELWSKAI